MNLFDHEDQRRRSDQINIPSKALDQIHNHKGSGAPTLLSLFCGSGGLDEGFRQAGFETLLGYDIEQHCVETLEANHPAAAYERDLSDVKIQEIVSHWRNRSQNTAPTGILGGPPCQSFSRSNVYKTADDPRDALPLHYARIIRGLNKAFSHKGEPGIDFFLFENVPGLLDEDHRPIYEKFKQAVRSGGYNVFESLLNASEFGVPQDRERIFIVGINQQSYKGKFEFPDPSRPTPTVGQTIRELEDPLYYSRGLTPEKIQEKTGHPNHWCMRPRSDKFDPDNDFLEPGEIKGRSFRTLAWNEPSYTVAYGHREVHVHPSTTRRLSIYEAMLLQGFPPKEKKIYELKGNLSNQIDMVSDAVPPPMAKGLAQRVVDTLGLLRSPEERTH
ncbi:DNA (cytosine-5)-methyltransferase 1 [Salinibacter ruber]|uniref:DNA cytosine methyltransferase n=1 Tax=Salinibacter ruber TaxID=146919 RepID=UPI0021696967|nr:DNA cytosine methyltransferase [Salinibacter ruber]MCS3627178.1 DNA (cytosine-5)-methyltransferase 1 [Salinibacter ruber]MCS4144085.1 DNA (cytosine-5)-methyltransferase 1 [Salinibacter ruber]